MIKAQCNKDTNSIKTQVYLVSKRQGKAQIKKKEKHKNNSMTKVYKTKARTRNKHKYPPMIKYHLSDK